MRKWILVAVLVTGLILIFVSIASADNGPHTGDFTGTTDACAGCHRVHRGQGEHLLRLATEQALCESCHGGTGAETDIVNGLYLGTGGGGLRGGGFTTAMMDTDVDGAPTAGTVTSKHNVGEVNVIWGNGAIGSGAGSMMAAALQCSSCHNPHGISGGNQYRILRPSLSEPLASGGPVALADEATKTYTVSYDTTTHFRDTGYIGQEISTWCSMCHTRYMSASTDTSGDSIFKYRHKTDSTGTGTGDRDCLSCHVAHGSSATMGGGSTNQWAAHVELPDGTTASSGANDSRLLQVDNRGICVKCHAQP